HQLVGRAPLLPVGPRRRVAEIDVFVVARRGAELLAYDVERPRHVRSGGEDYALALPPPAPPPAAAGSGMFAASSAGVTSPRSCASMAAINCAPVLMPAPGTDGDADLKLPGVISMRISTVHLVTLPWPMSRATLGSSSSRNTDDCSEISLARFSGLRASA